MLDQLRRRAELISAYAAKERDFELSVGEFLREGILKSPCTVLGRRFIEMIEDAGDHLKVKIHSVSTPLMWPKVVPLFDLYKVVTECFDENNWHFYEIPETRVSAGDVVLDCGAAEGIFGLRVLDRAARLALFEPLPVFGVSLRKTFESYPYVSVIPKALGSSPGTAYLTGGSLYGSVTSTPTQTPIGITTIDTWAAETQSKVDFIKGDLEGFESRVLSGARETIKRFKPKIAITVYHDGNNWRDIVGFLSDLVPDYQYCVKGLSYNAKQARPVMLHVWRGQS